MKDKEQTKRKLIDAVGIIIKTKGLDGVRISSVSRLAGVDRKLVYRYFGNLRNLIEAYVSENDYWMLFAEHLKTLLTEVNTANSKTIITGILQEQFKYFAGQKEMQNLIMMELSGSYDMLHSIHNVRESMGQQFLEMTDDHFKDSKVNFRAVAALLVGGLYYIVLHTRSNGGHFADIDLKTDDGMNAISKTLEQIIEWAYTAAAD